MPWTNLQGRFANRQDTNRSRFHPFDQLRPPLRRLERLGVVAGVAPDLAIAQLEDGHDGEDTSPTAVIDALDDSQAFSDDHSS